MSLIIRSSSLPEGGDCPRRWASRHIKGEVISAGYFLGETSTSIAALVGTGVHAGAAQALFREPVSIQQDAAHEAYKEAIAETETTIDYESNTPNIADGSRQITRMLTAYTDWLPEYIQPYIVEERREAAIADTGHILSGQVDTIVSGSLGDEDYNIQDLKTSAGIPNAMAQIGSYSMLAESVGDKISGASIALIRRGSLNKPQHPLTVLTVDVLAARQQAVTTMKSLIESYSRWLSLPRASMWSANPNSKLCSPKFCPAHPAHNKLGQRSFCQVALGEPDGD